jgi:hypothetical protein
MQDRDALELGECVLLLIEAKLREVADHHAADDPALAAQLYADADYLGQLLKASNVNGDNVADDAGSRRRDC